MIHIEHKLLEKIEEIIPLNTDSHLIIITDENVAKLYGGNLLKKLKENGQKVDMLTVPAGEQSKCQSMKSHLEDQMFKCGAKRNSIILALGGGVVGDLAGFVAATYMRGIKFIQIPTSLLAMVDSSVGGKTGINTSYGKNLIGAFYPAEEVIMDVDTLQTLAPEHITNGLIEGFKMFLTHDQKAFNNFSEQIDQLKSKDIPLLKEFIETAVSIKSAVVENDPKEKGERALLNAGHSIGHALEKLSNYELLHGFAVAYGLILEARISNITGHLSDEDLEKIEALLAKLDLRSENIPKLSAEVIYEAMKHDKKNTDEVKMVVLTGIGESLHNNNEFVHTLNLTDLKSAIDSLN